MSTLDEFKAIVKDMRNSERKEKIIRLYETWAELYDQDNATHFDYEGPHAVSNVLMKHLEDTQDAKIIDLGAGTGLVGQILSKHRYRNLDALDASRNMLDQAQKKGIYTRLICDYLGPNQLDIPDATYDAAVLCGAFVTSHINDSCFEEIVRILKPGAMFVFNISENYLDMPEFKGFTARLHQLAERGIWKVVARERRGYTKLADGEWDMSFVYSVQKQQ